MSMSENPSFGQLDQSLNPQPPTQSPVVISTVDEALYKINTAFLNLNEKINSIFARISNKVAQPSVEETLTETESNKVSQILPPST